MSLETLQVDLQRTIDKVQSENARRAQGVLVSIALMAGGAAFWWNSDSASWWGVGAAICFALAVGAGLVSIEAHANKKREETHERELRTQLGQTNPPYFERLAAINVTNLARYYAMVGTHARQGFVLAASACVVGFLFILFGVASMSGIDERLTRTTFQGQPEQAATPTPASSTSAQQSREAGQVAAIAGVVTEAIAALFFFLHNRTVQQLRDYHESLVSLQNVLLALTLIAPKGTATPIDSALVKTALEALLRTSPAPTAP